MARKKTTNLAELMKENAPNGGFCYVNYPYPCMLDESLAHVKNRVIKGSYEIVKSLGNNLEKVEIRLAPKAKPTRRNTITMHWQHWTQKHVQD